MKDIGGASGPRPPTKLQTAAPGRYFPAPSTDMWPSSNIDPLPPPNVLQDEPPHSQIIGDLPNLQLPEINEPPPSVSKDHYNSLLFLSRLLRTKDNLSAEDIKSMQKAEPLFSQVFDNVEKYNEFKLDKNGILFKLITPARGPKYFVLCLPQQFAISILQQFHEIDKFHVPKTVMLSHFCNKFFTPGIKSLLETSINSCLPCFLHNNAGIRQFKLYKRSITQTATGELLQLDLVTGLPASSEGFTVLLLLVCTASHYIIGLPLPNMLSTTIKAALTNIFHILPLPRYITCDHQSSLAAVQDFCSQNDVLCVKSTPTSKNELGSIDVACKIATQFLQKITTSLDQSLRLNWPRYVKILTDNLNSRHSNRNAFSRAEMYFGPIRFMPNHKLFAADIFDVCDKMLNESLSSHKRKEKESKRQSFNEELLKISYPRNSIVKLCLRKSERAARSFCPIQASSSK
jgi:hypothetical protein